LEFGQVEKE